MRPTPRVGRRARAGGGVRGAPDRRAEPVPVLPVLAQGSYALPSGLRRQRRRDGCRRPTRPCGPGSCTAGSRARSCGCRSCRREADAIRESGAKAAIYGLPFDGTNISRTGANGGPRAMRDVSCMTTTYHAMFDFDLVEESRLVDCGDCVGRARPTPTKTFERAQADISQILAGGAMPVVLGGEHSVDDPGRERDPRARRRPGPGPDRHPPRHGAGRRRRAAHPLLPDLPRRRRRLRSAQDGADRHLRLAEPARRARLLPRARHHGDLARGDLGARHRAGRSSGRSRWPARATASTCRSTSTRSTRRTPSAPAARRRAVSRAARRSS